MPASKEDLEGVGNLMQRGMESPVVAVLCVVGAVACLGQAALAGGAQWQAYIKLLDESRWVGRWAQSRCQAGVGVRGQRSSRVQGRW